MLNIYGWSYSIDGLMKGLKTVGASASSRAAVAFVLLNKVTSLKDFPKLLSPRRTPPAVSSCHLCPPPILSPVRKQEPARGDKRGDGPERERQTRASDQSLSAFFLSLGFLQGERQGCNDSTLPHRPEPDLGPERSPVPPSERRLERRFR